MDKQHSEVNNLKVSNTESIVALAISALDGNPNPLDQDMRSIGESPCDLDLPVEQPCRRKGVVPMRGAGVGHGNSAEMI